MDANQLKLIHEKLDRIAEKADLTHDLLTGGKEPSRGIIVRLDRAERTVATFKKVVWACVSAVITGLGGLLFGHKWH